MIGTTSALGRYCGIVTTGTKLLIIDWVLPPQPTAEAVTGYMVDMTMLVVTPGGRERTQRDFQELLDSAGFKFTSHTNRWAYRHRRGAEILRRGVIVNLSTG